MESVILPAPLVTVTWFDVPVNVAIVGSPLLSPIKSCPLVNTAVAVIASVPLPSKTPPSVSVLTPVPPSATAKSVIPLIVPPFISIVVNVPPSATVFPALVQLPCMLSISNVYEFNLPKEPLDKAEPLTLPLPSIVRAEPETPRLPETFKEPVSTLSNCFNLNLAIHLLFYLPTIF